ncbi:MAG: hypothetical protein JWQ25_115 [Daejeonella sp.]|nr:hypothetical protein [Daejeonella sp.]
MKLFFGLITLVHLFSACGQKTNESYSKAMTDSSQREFLRYTVLKDSTKASEWTPTDDEIRSIEVLIKEAIKEKQSEHNKRLKPDSLFRFYRQYTCYIENGDSMVFVNAFCTVSEIYELRTSGKLMRKRFDWQNKFLQVDDGGDCYWQMIINYSKKATKIFGINGRA